MSQQKNHILGLPTSHKPVNGTAARVVKPASALDQWRPMPKETEHIAASANVLRTAPFPWNTPAEVRAVVGRRRDRLTVVGFAAEQGSKSQQGKWVVRCDCGNFEHRTRILRWIGTQAPDMCIECRVRIGKTRGLQFSREKAKRETLR